MQEMTEKQKKKVWKILKKVYFYALSTSYNDIPQATIVKPAIRKDWKILIIANKKRVKVKNIQKNSKVWLIVDKTSIFRLPRVIYIKGTATVNPGTKEKFEEFLSYHSRVTRRILRRVARDEEIQDSVLIEITPEKFITVGISGKMHEEVSFKAPVSQ